MKKPFIAIVAAAILATGMSFDINAAQREAFPGAEGYGRLTTGGRGGTVYHVTTLEDNNQPGSFRYACTRSGARTIVFDVSGTIYLKSALRMNQGNVTIAGQTAPGDGICIADYPFSIACNNVIIRFMRFRVGNRQVAYHEGDGLGGMDQKNIIIDHCSVSWSIDECLSVYGSENITVQWCIASHSLRNAGHSKGAHGYGGNWGGKGASYHHNLISDHTSRTPRLGPRQGTQTDERMDMRNNVIYNYGTNGCYGGEGMNVNIVNNYYKPGLTSNSRKTRIAGVGVRTLKYCFEADATLKNVNAALGTSYTNIDIKRTQGQDVITFGGVIHPINHATNSIEHEGVTIPIVWNDWHPMLHKWGRFFVEGNVNASDATVAADNWGKGMYPHIDNASNDYTFTDEVRSEMRLAEPIEFVYTTTHSSEDAYRKVLAYAGASHARDEYDRIVVADVEAGKASFTSDGIIDSQDQVKYADGSTGWPALRTASTPVDSDGDGMPDEWEKAKGLNPNNAADGKEYAPSGYTWLEEYMNSLVDSIMTGGNEGGVMYNGTQTGGAPSTPPDEPDAPGDEILTETVIAASTYTGNGASSSIWNFGDNVTVSNENGKGYGAGINDCVKYSKGVQFTVTLPEGQRARTVLFEGYDNYDTPDAYFGEVAGLEGTQWVFPKKENGSAVMTAHTVTLPSSTANSFTFTPMGNQLVLKMTVSAATSGLESVIAPEGWTDSSVYNLMGVRCREPLAPGIYIRGGRKFVVR